jgi:hypothetical protein
MQLIHPGPNEALLCLRAVRSVVTRADGIPPAARAMMTAAQQSILNTDADLDGLAPITPAQLAAGIATPGLADQVVQAMLLGILADGAPVPECEKLVEAFAVALGVSIPALRTVRLLCEQHMLLFRLDFLRRSNFKDMIVDQYQHHGGIRGVVQGLLGMRGFRDGTTSPRQTSRLSRQRWQTQGSPPVSSRPSSAVRGSTPTYPRTGIIGHSLSCPWPRRGRGSVSSEGERCPAYCL